jgi:cellulose synthase/poly-beta-1,6-N-acetylglucosamine synthase-like glycosyltransferase
VLVVDIALVVFLVPFAVVALVRFQHWVAGKPSAPEGAPAGGWPPVTVLVPAHDEEALIPECLQSLGAQDYPGKVRVVVLADRCTDATADRAREHGAIVLERHSGEPGKGTLLRWALDRDEMGEDLVAVVDADSTASPDLLRACVLRAGRGQAAVQAHHGVRRAGTSLLGCIMDAAASVRRRVLAGRDRHGLAAPLLGTGMLFRPEALAAGWDAEGLAEDRELGARLVLRGQVPRFAGEVEILSEGPGGLGEARRQRLRWSRGETAVTREMVPRLLARALRRGEAARPVAFELALDLAIPSLSVRAACIVVLGALAVLADSGAVWIAAVALALEAIPFVIALLARHRLRGLLALAAAPFYVAWKTILVLEAALPGSHPWRPTREEGR